MNFNIPKYITGSLREQEEEKRQPEIRLRFAE